MKIGIFGLPLAGKKTIFKILSGEEPGPHARGEPVEGFTLVNDPRLSNLEKIYRPRRTVKARLYLELLPDLDEANSAGEKILPFLGACDALCFAVRSFEDATVYHPNGSVDPGRDLMNLKSELIIHDLALAEKRIDRIAKEKKAQKNAGEIELPLMERLKASLEEEKPLRSLDLNEHEKAIISGYAFLTMKPAVCAVNTGENNHGKPVVHSAAGDDDIPVVEFCAKLEAEIEEFPRGPERDAMLEAMGIKKPAAEELKSAFLRALDLVTFFTAAGGELRQWLTPANSTASKAAGKIHSDMEKGFIKAEIIKYCDLVESGSEEKAASLGKKTLKGRDVKISDGDILNIRFSV